MLAPCLVCDFWIPILLTSVGVFIASCVVHMVFKYHNNDFKRYEKEDELMKIIDKMKICAGQYFIPSAIPFKGGHGNPEYQKKYQKGPTFILKIFDTTDISMGRQMGFWYLYCLFCAMMTPLLYGRFLTSEDESCRVFKYVMLSSFLCYFCAMAQMSIWYKRPWCVTMKYFLDGLIYSAVHATIFMLWWP